MLRYLLVGCGLLYIAMPFLDVALHRYDNPVAFFAGVFVALFALPYKCHY
jgi:hypothetical protein